MVPGLFATNTSKKQIPREAYSECGTACDGEIHRKFSLDNYVEAKYNKTTYHSSLSLNNVCIKIDKDGAGAI